jgi:integrase
VDETLHTGLRQGEVFALRVGDVDLDEGVLHVRQAVVKDRYEIGAPKSESSARSIKLDQGTVDLLAYVIGDRPADAYVFPNPTTGEWWRASIFTKVYWNPARDKARKAGLRKPVRFHDLRHTHAAWLLNAPNVNLLAVSRRLGHDSIGITGDIYGHITPEGDAAVRAALDAKRANSKRRLRSV